MYFRQSLIYLYEESQKFLNHFHIELGILKLKFEQYKAFYQGFELEQYYYQQVNFFLQDDHCFEMEEIEVESLAHFNLGVYNLAFVNLSFVFFDKLLEL